ncbi:site-specific integrase [Acidocella sp.]|uniref:tyrosine-type recombinase/integrase n=1 Tax=Acidocella sp. TaxID=50710 RepID=UPI00262DE268|nr:site-specific integrase [Acidocella sp.]
MWKFASLGAADDLLDADGIDTLNFTQAQEKAREWFAGITRTRRGAPEPTTVEQAMTAYLADYKARGGKDPKGLASTIEAHIKPKLGEKKLSDLTTAIIRKWHQGLAITAPRLRTKRTATKQAVREVAEDDTEGKRARRASANRVLTVLKAALNLAYADGKVESDDAWRRVKPFKAVEAARVRFLTDDEATRLVNAAGTDFRPMITAALLTGARWGELVAFKVADFNPEAGTLHVRVSKTGKPRHIMLTDEGKAFFTQQCTGKTGKSLILPRPDGEDWGKSEQHRPMRAACKTAKIAPAIGFHILRHTHASRLAMSGVPLGVIAAQLGNSEAICAKHYAHLCPGYVAESIRAAFTPLGIVSESNVTALKKA